MKKLKDFDLQGKNVLIRCDLNAPVSPEGKVLDNFRIKSVLPTIRYLIKEKARVILIAHLEKRDKTYSLKHLINELEELLDQKVFFFSDYLKKRARKTIEEKVDFGEVVLLENLRFHKGEKKNSDSFAKKLASLGDVFANNAFSVCHRPHASIIGIPKYLSSTVGFLFQKELENLNKLLENPERPFVVIIGGVKIKTKGKAVLNSLRIADFVLVGSKIQEHIFSQKGILENRDLPVFDFLDKIDLDDEKVVFPKDGVFASQKTRNNLRKAPIKDLKENEDFLDIGPESIREFKKKIKSAKTILWSGPVGMFEDERFDDGTKAIVKAILKNEPSFSVAGGGETISFIRKYDLKEGFDFLSTGGGAMLRLLDKKPLPGIKALKYGN